MSDTDDKKNGFQRRDVLKLGLVAAGGALAGTGVARAYSSGGSYSGSGGTVSSPTLTAFVDPLPIPPVAQSVAALSPPPNPAAHQRYNEFLPQKFYDISQREGTHQFHRDLPATTIWGFNGMTPGPTFFARYGEPVLVRFRNNLPASNTGYGIPSVITHLHNAHNASESDGYTLDYYEVGQFKDHHYPNVLAGYDAYPPSGDVREALSTLWYHDHRVDFTAPNVYRGLAGFYFLFDDFDTGDENDPSPRASRLPSGEFDVPLIFQDRRFSADGSAVFDQFDLNGFIGDRFCVNGKVQPFFKVAARKYRLRLLNGGPSRFYEFFLSNGASFTQISSDGNLLPAPISRKSIRLGVAERADVILDFSAYPLGTQITLDNRLQQSSGRGPGGLSSTGTPLLRFEVDRPARDFSQVPAKLRELPPVNLNEVVTTRNWTFDNQNGAWTINGRLFDSNRVDATVKRGTAEIWVLTNPYRDWSHPIHIHFEEFQIISRNGQATPVDEVSRKDVVRLAPGEQVKIFMRFRDFTGRYLMHCHNNIHEDHGMMLRWDVVA